MEKKHLIRFLRERKKGSYSVLVQAYQELIASMPIVMALEIIKEDLQKESEERIELNYFSLARAIARFKKKNPQAAQSKQFQFKDAHEINDVQLRVPLKTFPLTTSSFILLLKEKVRRSF